MRTRFAGININNCQFGFQITTGGTTQDDQGAGGEAIIDAVVTNTPTFIQNSQPSNGSLRGALVLNHILLNNVATAVGVAGGTVLLSGVPGGTVTIDSWAQGNVYTGTDPNGHFIQSGIPSIHKDPSLLDSQGRIFGRGHPQYENYAPDQFVSVKSQGARGDGRTDDTAAIQAVFDQVCLGLCYMFDTFGHI